MKLARDRIYLTTLMITVIGIVATAFFLYRDLADPTIARVSLGTTGGGTGAAPTGAAGQVVSVPGSSGGGGGSGGSSGGGSGSGGGATGCQGGTITLGQIVPITGPVSEQTAEDAAQSYVKMLNSQGGLNGCQVRLISLDDGGLNQQQAAADARQLVSQDHVFAIVGNIEPVTGASTASYFASAGIPVIGSDGVGVQEYNQPNQFSFAEDPQGFGISTANELARLGFKHPAIFYLDFDFGHASYQAFASQVAHNGGTVAYSNAENVSSQSYPTDVLAARQSGADVVVNILDANSAVRELQAMQSQAWFPNMVSTTSTSDPVVISSESGWFSHPGHVVYTQRNYTPPSQPTAEVSLWMNTQRSDFPGNFDPNSYAEGAWLGMKVFADYAKKLGPGMTQASLIQALDHMSGYSNGITVPLTMTPNHGPNQEIIWEKWNGSAFVPVTGWVGW